MSLLSLANLRNATVVCPVTADRTQRFAAEELQTYVEQMTGVENPHRGSSGFRRVCF
jgi:hypothetical protein